MYTSYIEPQLSDKVKTHIHTHTHMYIYIYIYICIYMHMCIHIHIHMWSELLVPLVNMIKEGCGNKSALLILLIFCLKKSKKSNLSLENKNLKWQKLQFFFSKTHWTQLNVPFYSILFEKIRNHSFIQNHPRPFKFTAPCWCFFSSVHFTHFLQGSGQRTGMTIEKTWFLLSDPFLCFWGLCLDYYPVERSKHGSL